MNKENDVEHDHKYVVLVICQIGLKFQDDACCLVNFCC